MTLLANSSVSSKDTTGVIFAVWINFNPKMAQVLFYLKLEARPGFPVFLTSASRVRLDLAPASSPSVNTLSFFTLEVSV